MNFVTWIVAGALLGRAASALSGPCDWKWLAVNVATGIAGVMSGGWLLGVLIGTSAFAPGHLSLASLLVSLMVAGVLLLALQILGHGAMPHRSKTRIVAAAAFRTAGSAAPVASST